MSTSSVSQNSPLINLAICLLTISGCSWWGAEPAPFTMCIANLITLMLMMIILMVSMIWSDQDYQLNTFDADGDCVEKYLDHGVDFGFFTSPSIQLTGWPAPFQSQGLWEFGYGAFHTNYYERGQQQNIIQDIKFQLWAFLRFWRKPVSNNKQRLNRNRFVCTLAVNLVRWFSSKKKSNNWGSITKSSKSFEEEKKSYTIEDQSSKAWILWRTWSTELSARSRFRR